MVQPRIIFALVAGFVGLAAPAAAIEYLVEDIGPVFAVLAINNRGEVLARDANGSFVYRRGRADYLPQPPGGTFTPTALNDAGEVVGYFNRLGMYDYDLAIYCHGEVKIL